MVTLHKQSTSSYVRKLILDSHHKCCLIWTMTSLTSFLPILVSHLGISQAAIYERQRALVRLGLLPKPVGRGRGSGADASPHSVSLIIPSALATDNLSDMDERIVGLARAPAYESRKACLCYETKQCLFMRWPRHSMTTQLQNELRV
jgi:hypothetical protein